MKKKQITSGIFIAVLVVVSVSGAVWFLDKYNIEKRVIDIYGDTFYDMGLMYGSRVKNILGGIGALINLAEKLLNSLPGLNLTEIIDGYEQYMPNYVIDIMRGLANATGVDYDDIVLLNGFADFAEVLISEFIGCSQFAVINNTIPGLGAVYARTLDYMLPRLFENWQVVLRIRPPAGSGLNSVMGTTIGGWVGFLSGMSDVGVSMGVTQIRTTEVGPGTPVPVIILDTLMNNSNTINAVQHITNGSPSYLRHAGAWTYMVLDRTEVSAVIEVTHLANQTRWHADEGTDYFVSTNHFVTDEMIPHGTPVDPEADTIYRKQVLEQVLLNKEDFDLEDVVNALRSHYDITIHGDPGFPYHNCVCNNDMGASMHGFVAVVLQNYTLVCFNNPTRGPFYLISFSEVIGPIA